MQFIDEQLSSIASELFSNYEPNKLDLLDVWKYVRQEDLLVKKLKEINNNKPDLSVKDAIVPQVRI